MLNICKKISQTVNELHMTIQLGCLSSDALSLSGRYMNNSVSSPKTVCLYICLQTSQTVNELHMSIQLG